jgi:hypothetical protein
MKNLTFYLIVIIIILSGLTYTYYSLNKKHKQDSIRWEKNYTETNKQVQQIDLTLNEFKKSIDNKTDSILKIANIKPKNVTQITNNYTTYKDTIINEIKPVYEQKTGTYPFVDKQGCFEFGGFINVIDTFPELFITDRKFNSDFTEIEYIKKDTMHFLWLDWVKWWQKADITYTIIDNCTGEKHVKKINVKKP